MDCKRSLNSYSDVLNKYMLVPVQTAICFRMQCTNENISELSLGVGTAGVLALAIAIKSCVIAAQLSSYSKLCNNILLTTPTTVPRAGHDACVNRQ